jgi:hypothetical protein
VVAGPSPELRDTASESLPANKKDTRQRRRVLFPRPTQGSPTTKPSPAREPPRPPTTRATRGSRAPSRRWSGVRAPGRILARLRSSTQTPTTVARVDEMHRSRRRVALLAVVLVAVTAGIALAVSGGSGSSDVDCDSFSFDRAAWDRLDRSNETLTGRQRQADGLIACRVLLGASAREVVALLGRPEERDDREWRTNSARREARSRSIASTSTSFCATAGWWRSRSIKADPDASRAERGVRRFT